jgi:hypothetical protein
MPLGPQFRNTFHTDEHGNMVFHTDLRSVPDHPEDFAEEVKPSISSEGAPGVPYQGMLFSPYAATGHRNDPLIPHEVRKEVFHKALNTGNLEQYTENAARELGKSYRPSTSQAEQSASLINQTAFESGIPTHLAAQINANAVLYPKQKARNGGHFNPGSRSIIVHKKTPYSYEKQPDIEVPSGKKGAPIQNPNFSKMIKTHYFGSERMWQEDMANGGVVPKTEVTLADENGNPYSYGGEEAGHHFQELPEGHSANVWAGEGKSTDKYIATSFKVEGSGRHNKWGEYTPTYKTFHTRHERLPGEGTEVIKGKLVKKFGNPSINSGALVHEIGHSMDPHVSDTLAYPNPDPVLEGTADGYEDRFNKHKDDYEIALSPSPRRASSIKSFGYGTEKFPSRFHQALYAAVRQHVSMGDTNAQDIMSRSQAFEKAGEKVPRFGGATTNDQRFKASQLLLGHLYTHHDHVRSILDHLKLADEGEKAANVYRQRVTDAGITHTQPAIPGFETHGE